VARTIGDIADEVLEKSLEITRMNKEVADLEKEEKALKEELRVAAEAAGLTSGGGKTSKFDIGPETVPQISNVDAFYDYIKTNDYFHLLQRRPAVKACRELWEQGTAIPGIDKFTQTKVNVKGV
jgi:hypothetical protein